MIVLGERNFIKTRRPCAKKDNNFVTLIVLKPLKEHLPTHKQYKFAKNRNYQLHGKCLERRNDNEAIRDKKKYAKQGLTYHTVHEFIINLGKYLTR